MTSEADAVIEAFKLVFPRSEPRTFGRGNRILGCSDDNDGVQWHAGVDEERDSAWLGVNLEGQSYGDRWPITRLIRHELENPSFLGVAAGLPRRDGIHVYWRREARQGNARPPILENYITDSPLVQLTDAAWKSGLAEAQECLAREKNYNGWARQWVTLRKSGRAYKLVSPHLCIRFWLWQVTPPFQEAVAQMSEARDLLRPIHEWATSRST